MIEEGGDEDEDHEKKASPRADQPRFVSQKITVAEQIMVARHYYYRHAFSLREIFGTVLGTPDEDIYRCPYLQCTIVDCVPRRFLSPGSGGKKDGRTCENIRKSWRQGVFFLLYINWILNRNFKRSKKSQVEFY